jgi:hypothetical protein
VTVLVWPEKVLAPRAIDADLDVRSLSGGPSMSGEELIVSTGSGRWRIAFSGVPVMTAAQQRCWNAISTLLDGRAGLIAVPVAQWFLAPWPLNPDGSRKVYADTLHDDDTPYGDDTGHAEKTIVATFRAAAAGTASVVIDLLDGQPLEPGHVFGTSAHRAYKIKTVSASGSAYTCTVAPTLREAVTLGQSVELDNPRVKCRLASDASMRLSRDLGRFAVADLEFIEVW